jgi:hypothetical protein
MGNVACGPADALDKASKQGATQKSSASTLTKKTRAPADRLNADTLDVICSFCDEQTLVATLAHASKPIASVVDVHAAARAKRLWTTSAELERRGVRLGTAFLARRSRPPRKLTDGSWVPLASQTLELRAADRFLRELRMRRQVAIRERRRPGWFDRARLEMLQTMPEIWAGRPAEFRFHLTDEEAVDKLHELLEAHVTHRSLLSLPGRVLVVEVIVRNADGDVVGRRSVILNSFEPFANAVVHFEPLRIAEGLEPCHFWSDPHDDDVRPEHPWLAEVGNVVGCHQYACVENGRRFITGMVGVNHEFPAQLLESGFIDAYRPSQLQENHRYVSVRVDLLRLSDGKSMCLGEHDVGIRNHHEWPGESTTYADEDDGRIHLVPSDTRDYKHSLLPQPRPKGENDCLALHSYVLADYPQETPGALDLVAVSVAFLCPDPDPFPSDPDDFCFYGPGVTNDKVVRALLALDAWT